jgi:ferredoxin--NADP+ reductase
VKNNRLNKNIVISNEEIADGVFLLSFERNFDFTPGQIIALTLDSKDLEPRLYSICSGTEEKVVSILFNIVPQGKITGKLAALLPGDIVYSSNPYGRFSPGMESAFWIATGSGIAPFISGIRSGDIKDTYLIHGGREQESFYFSDELSRLFKDNYTRCSSTIDKEGIYSGRVTDYLKSTAYLPADYRYYLCGRAEMVVESRDILISRGIPYNMIESEIYF